jgi:hypothetical protein
MGFGVFKAVLWIATPWNEEDKYGRFGYTARFHDTCSAYIYAPPPEKNGTNYRGTLTQDMTWNKYCSVDLWGHPVAQLVEAMRYKPEGRGFDSRCCHWHNPSGRTMALGRLSL